MNKANYIVYKHTSPSNKVYIGITCQSMELRAGADGYRYRKNEYFYRAIQKYGWDNFEHKILFEQLTKSQACRKEQELIAKYHSNDFNYGYNITAGGEGRLQSPQSKETREKISLASKKQWQNKTIRNKHIKSAKGREVSLETREKIRNSQLGKYVPQEVGKKISEAKKGKHPWNYGIKCGPRSEETKAKISAYNKGKVISEKHKQQISKKLKGREITPEWRAKISATLKERNKERRLLLNEKENL